jgi:hypothetical protein
LRFLRAAEGGHPREDGVCRRVDTSRAAAADEAVADAEQGFRRLHAAIEHGVDPAALVEPINRAQEVLEAARFERQRVPSVEAPAC